MILINFKCVHAIKNILLNMHYFLIHPNGAGSPNQFGTHTSVGCFLFSARCYLTFKVSDAFLWLSRCLQTLYVY